MIIVIIIIIIIILMIIVIIIIMMMMFGVGKVELNSSAYHRMPCPPESGVAPLPSASN